jgi:hypothetical protein
MVRILGFCGTAKNTGKTTAMKVVMDGAYARGLRLALTSIGFDGELADHVTGLPKPRIYVENGTLAAIAEGCAKASGAALEILKRTDIDTALGRVVIGRVRKPGLLLLAGPTKSVEIRRANAMLTEAGCDLILVDGALNRIAPMVETDGILMSTGASRQTDIDLLARETADIGRIYELPVYPRGDGEGWRDRAAAGLVLEAASVLDEAMAEELLARLGPGIEAVAVKGIIGGEGFETLLEKGGGRLQGVTLIFEDPIKLLVSGGPADLRHWLGALENMGARIAVGRQVPLKLITVNPFYPRYRYATHDYEAAYVDKERLRESIARLVRVPVVNVLDETEEEIFRRVMEG